MKQGLKEGKNIVYNRYQAKVRDSEVFYGKRKSKL